MALLLPLLLLLLLLLLLVLTPTLVASAVAPFSVAFAAGCRTSALVFQSQQVRDNMQAVQFTDIVQINAKCAHTCVLTGCTDDTCMIWVRADIIGHARINM